MEMIKILPKSWINYFQEHPLTAKIILSTLGLVIYLALGFGVIQQLDQLNRRAQERERQANLSYQQQTETLKNVEQNLNDLIQFVQAQREKLKESEDTINDLKKEQQKIKPVVEADRKTIDAIFELQSQRNKREIWKERGIGFLLGVLASAVATFIVSLLRSVLSKKKALVAKESA